MPINFPMVVKNLRPRASGPASSDSSSTSELLSPPPLVLTTKSETPPTKTAAPQPSSTPPQTSSTPPQKTTPKTASNAKTPAAAAPSSSSPAAEPRPADEPPTPEDDWSASLDKYRAEQKAADANAYAGYEKFVAELNKELPNQEKHWRDKINELKGQPLESKNMNPLLAFAAAMGAPEQTAKTVGTNNEAIARERLTRQQQSAEMELMAVKGGIEDSLRKGQWKQALELIRVQKELDNNLENFKRHAESLQLQEQGRIQGDLLDKKNKALLDGVMLKLKAMSSKMAIADSAELNRIFGQVRANMSSNGIQYGTEGDIMQRVASQYNATHFGSDGKYFDPILGIVDTKQSASSGGSNGGGVQFNNKINWIGKENAQDSPPNMSTYDISTLRRFSEMKTDTVSETERAALTNEINRRVAANNKAIKDQRPKVYH